MQGTAQAALDTASAGVCCVLTAAHAAAQNRALLRHVVVRSSAVAACVVGACALSAISRWKWRLGSRRRNVLRGSCEGPFARDGRAVLWQCLQRQSKLGRCLRKRVCHLADGETCCSAEVRTGCCCSGGQRRRCGGRGGSCCVAHEAPAAGRARALSAWNCFLHSAALLPSTCSAILSHLQQACAEMVACCIRGVVSCDSGSGSLLPCAGSQACKHRSNTIATGRICTLADCGAERTCPTHPCQSPSLP